MGLREEQSRDHDAVRVIHQRSFGEHGDRVAGLVDALRRADPEAVSFVHETGMPVGHVLLTRGLLDTPRKLVDVATLSPLAVLPEHRRRGIGLALIRRGLDELDQRGVPLVFLEGDPGYYARAGFLPAVPRGFRKPSLRIADAAFQVIKLSAFQQWMSGTFVYAQTFWEYDCVGLRDEDL